MKNKNKIIIFLIVIFLAGVVWFFGSDSNKYPISGEISRCSFDDTIVYQFLDEKVDSFPEYFDDQGERIVCDVIGGETSERCGKFLDSLSECEIVYRFFEEEKVLRVFSTEAESVLPLIMKTKKLDF